ncbi:hypothetical protein HanXRQr2_Chr06g0270181 [Helianthus annuus]|uniref:Uncharacterized protein n=1 Tax=Helianthus annuus TaxID=4232 RepID=A0A9K3NKA0_HELAN|nr:hypothetical protein HanXRQr2_Chr06g0270181 [Helianthus annuus]KAJ0916362.1 hypothetical protein HanPSC8_Chr06g0260771 [Helianthus annuus]
MLETLRQSFATGIRTLQMKSPRHVFIGSPFSTRWVHTKWLLHFVRNDHCHFVRNGHIPFRAKWKIDDGLIDTSQELTAENLMKMADKVLAAKELEVDSSTGTESKSQVSQIDTNHVSGKKVKIESDCKNCMKNCKDCSTIAYLNNKSVEDLTKRVREVENQILNRDKMLKASNDRAKELTEKIESDYMISQFSRISCPDILI